MKLGHARSVALGTRVVTTDRCQCIWRFPEGGHVIDQLLGITHLKILTLVLLV